METRINPFTASPKAYEAMGALGKFADNCGLERPLLELVKMRASQINGCAFCLDMHSKDARALGETEQRLYLLNAWRESPFYSSRERLALEWTEAVTQISEGGVSEDLYQRASQEFTPEELANLNLVVVAINGWNRFCIAFEVPTGTYKSNLHPLRANA